VALVGLARWAPRLDDEPTRCHWTTKCAAGFVLLGLTYLNLRKNVSQWVKFQAVPEEMVGIAAATWFDLGYLLLGMTLLALAARHDQRPLAIMPASWLGKGQLFYLVLLWWLVAGNFERALVGFSAERLITEGVIYVVALACTLLVLVSNPMDRSGAELPPPPHGRVRPGLAWIIAVGLVAAAFSILVDWTVVRAIYGDRFAGHANLHIRFGPNATIRRPETR
jgi:hypothetical protein